MKTYRAGQPPQDPAALPGFLRSELSAIEQAANRANPKGALLYLHVAPTKAAAGDLVLADGSDWNPGSGAGPYLRNEANTGWVFVAGPAFQRKKFTGTTGAVGAVVTVAHGLTLSKILGLDVLVTSGTTRIGPNRTAGATDAFRVSVDATNINVAVDAAGASVASQPFTALITYEE